MTDEATMTLTVDGVTTAPFTLDDLKAATGALKGAGRMNADPEFNPLASLSDAERADYGILKRNEYSRSEALVAIGRADLVTT